MTAPPQIRVVEFLTDFNIGGTERQVLELTAGIDRDAFLPSLACLKLRGRFLDLVQRHTIDVAEYRVESLLSLRTVAAQIRFARALRADRVDIVHTYGFYANVFGIPPARLARRPLTIASVRDTGAHLSSPKRFLQRMACAHADCLVVNAHAVKRWIESQGYVPGDIRVIHNGIRFREPARRSGYLHREFALPPGAPIVGVLARLNDVKGVEHFLEAARSVSAGDERVRFLVVGDGPLRESLEAIARRLGVDRRVVFTGFRTDTADIAGELDISVLPSLSEGLSNVLLESMAAGVPVVATRVGGTPEIVDSGQTGILVPPADPLALAQAIRSLLDDGDLRARLGAEGREHVRREFRVETMVARTERLYAELEQRRRREPSRLVGRYVE
jgi:glycosyltransferase involved in cell wall biosynthesis